MGTFDVWKLLWRLTVKQSASYGKLEYLRLGCVAFVDLPRVYEIYCTSLKGQKLWHSRFSFNMILIQNSKKLLHVSNQAKHTQRSLLVLNRGFAENFCVIFLEIHLFFAAIKNSFSSRYGKKPFKGMKCDISL